MEKKDTPRTRRSFPDEFKADAVAMVLDDDRKIVDVAEAIGVGDGTLAVSAQDPAARMRYAYGLNNPLAYQDLTGLAADLASVMVTLAIRSPRVWPTPTSVSRRTT